MSKNRINPATETKKTNITNITKRELERAQKQAACLAAIQGLSLQSRGNLDAIAMLRRQGGRQLLRLNFQLKQALADKLQTILNQTPRGEHEVEQYLALIHLVQVKYLDMRPMDDGSSWIGNKTLWLQEFTGVEDTYRVTLGNGPVCTPRPLAGIAQWCVDLWHETQAAYKGLSIPEGDNTLRGLECAFAK